VWSEGSRGVQRRPKGSRGVQRGSEGLEGSKGVQRGPEVCHVIQLLIKEPPYACVCVLCAFSCRVGLVEVWPVVGDGLPWFPQRRLPQVSRPSSPRVVLFIALVFCECKI